VRARTLLPLLLLVAAAPPTLAGPEEQAPGCKHWAVLLPEDAGQMRVYDGIRKGLELAQLERVCLKDLADTEEAFRGFVQEHAALPEPKPLVFVIGRRTCDHMLTAGFAGPGVYVSEEWTAEGAMLRDEPPLPAGVGRARAELPVETLGQVLREALRRERVVVGLEGSGAPGWSAAFTRLCAAARLAALDATRPDAVLHLRLGAMRPIGATSPSDGPPSAGCWVSDDVLHYGTGAAFVLCSDHERLGRAAAEVGRRLWRREPVREPIVVRGVQVLVDLAACEAQGVNPPLTFLAGVDGLKGRR
jgi:hypothetical protein